MTKNGLSSYNALAFAIAAFEKQEKFKRENNKNEFNENSNAKKVLTSIYIIPLQIKLSIQELK
jgi:ubiquinone/menaquinone biosynthesis C-methylase UbiE